MNLTDSQRYVLLNSLFYAMYTGFGLNFIVPFALALKANNTYIGILSAMPFVAMILSQYPSQVLMQKINRRFMYLFLSSASRIGLPIAGMAPQLFGPLALPLLLLVIFLTYLLDTMAEPAWFSIMSETITKKGRGEFFGLRMLIFHIGFTGALLIGGVYLDMFPKDSIGGFMSIFMLAALCGIASTYFFQKIKPKKYLDKKEHSLKEFFTFKGMFGKFILFVFFFSFAQMIVAPFFKVYILEDLAMSYTFYVMVMATSTIGRLISIVHLGKLSDLVGDKKIAVISATATAFSPFAYLFINGSTVWLLFPVHIIIGIAWAGIEVSTLNLLMNYSSKRERGLRAAQYYMMSAIPMVIAPIVGGMIADNVTLMAFSGIPLVFLIATVLRSLPALLLLRLKEVRVKKKYSYFDVLKRYAKFDPAKEAKNSIHEIEHVLLHKHHWHKQRR